MVGIEQSLPLSGTKQSNHAVATEMTKGELAIRTRRDG